MLDFCILLLILIIIFSIIYFGNCSAGKGVGILGGAVALLSLNKSEVLGGAACNNAVQPLEPLQGFNIADNHIICDGTNMMHAIAKIKNLEIKDTPDKMYCLMEVAKTLKKKFPLAPGIHIVTKNQNIKTYIMRDFRRSSYYRDYNYDLKNKIPKEANNYAAHKLYELGYGGYEKDYKDQFIRIANTEYARLKDVYYRWHESEFKRDDLAAWRTAMERDIERATKYHLQEIKNVSEQLKNSGINDVHFHLAYEYSVAEKGKDPHHYESRDDVVSIMLASGMNDVLGIDDIKSSALVSMDYFKDADTLKMHEVPRFEYIHVKDGVISGPKSIKIKEILGGNPRDGEFTQKVDELRRASKLLGYTIVPAAEDKQEEYVNPIPYRQSNPRGFAPNHCLYIRLAVAPPKVILPPPSTTPPSTTQPSKLAPSPNLTAALKIGPKKQKVSYASVIKNP